MKKNILLMIACFVFSVYAQVFVDCETTKGPIEIQLEERWSPLGAERFVLLVSGGFFKDIPLFRCVDDFLCQFGYNGNQKNPLFEQTFKDDKVKKRKFQRGFVSFAGNGKDSRSCHLFITLGENVESLGTEPWETPIGFVTDSSMKNVVSRWTTKYGDMQPYGSGPDPHLIESRGDSYLRKKFP